MSSLKRFPAREFNGQRTRFLNIAMVCDSIGNTRTCIGSSWCNMNHILLCSLKGKDLWMYACKINIYLCMYVSIRMYVYMYVCIYLYSHTYMCVFVLYSKNLFLPFGFCIKHHHSWNKICLKFKTFYFAILYLVFAF